MESPLERPRLNFWQLVNMSAGFMGIQFAWSIQMGQMSAIYERLGAAPEQLSLLWLAGPVTGMLVQPLVGSMSDRTWGRLGRRRPYFLAGAVLASLALLAMPNAPALWVAASLLWILDASINISMEPFRALVADVTPPPQRPAAYSYQSLAIGLGSVASFFIGGMAIAAPFLPGPTHTLFYLGTLVLLATILWTVFSTREYPPEPGERHAGGLMSWLPETLTSIREMPTGMRQLAWVQVFTWFGFHCLFIYFSVTVARNVFHGLPATPAYDQGIAWASFCFLAMNMACFLASPLLAWLAPRVRQQHLHTAALLLGGLAMIALRFATTPALTMGLMVGVGICWAATLSIPYALLAGAIPAARFGVYMGTFNLFITLPQFVCSLGMGPLVAALGGDPAIALAAGGASMLLAALAVQRVRDPDGATERTGVLVGS